MTTYTMCVDNIKELEQKLCLICAPTLAKAFKEDYDLTITILDIDKRFDNLPGFRYFDLRDP